MSDLCRLSSDWRFLFPHSFACMLLSFTLLPPSNTHFPSPRLCKETVILVFLSSVLFNPPSGAVGLTGQQNTFLIPVLNSGGPAARLSVYSRNFGNLTQCRSAGCHRFPRGSRGTPWASQAVCARLRYSF